MSCRCRPNGDSKAAHRHCSYSLSFSLELILPEQPVCPPPYMHGAWQSMHLPASAASVGRHQPRGSEYDIGSQSTWRARYGAAHTLPVRMECTTLLLSHMVAPDCPSLATQLCCRMLAQRCRSIRKQLEST